LSAFQAYDLEKVQLLRHEELDAAPFGIIIVDRSGTILEYNAYERSLAHLGNREVAGRNFFTDVVPCTAIRDFQGRFAEFLSSNEVSIEPFEFVFAFPHGPERVCVVFVRLADDRDRATICVIRTEVADPLPQTEPPIRAPSSPAAQVHPCAAAMPSAASRSCRPAVGVRMRMRRTGAGTSTT
jgi:photoactive yellow protein